MRKTIAIAAALCCIGSVAAVAHTVDQSTQGASWSLQVVGDEAKLAYGRPSSDLLVVMMTCRSGEGAVMVSGEASFAQPSLVLISGGSRLTLAGPAQADPFSGGAIVEARAPLQAPTFSRFAQSGELALAVGGRSRIIGANAKARGDIRRFFAHCEG